MPTTTTATPRVTRSAGAGANTLIWWLFQIVRHQLSQGLPARYLKGTGRGLGVVRGEKKGMEVVGVVQD